MVFKKPYAFFIKYFKLINFVLSLLIFYLVCKLNLLHGIVNKIYLNSVTNYSSLNTDYIGFRMYLLLFTISLFLIIIILTLKRKKKPLRDYIFCLIYIFILIIYLMSVTNFFMELDESVIEQTTLKLFSDISFLIYVPLLYFVFIFLITSIGFNIKKFNFTKDIIELKQDSSDNEEVEIVLNKNAYKYKRKFRRTLRELKYYYLENKLLINIIFFIILLITFSSLVGLRIFKSNTVSLNKTFVAGNFSYTINDIYETKYSNENKLINKNYKYIIINTKITNNSLEATTIDFKKIRLIYGNEYVYSNNYYNEYFRDLGKPYNNETIVNGTLYYYSFIFRIPSNYNGHNYKIKFYDKLVFENNELGSSYKVVKANAKVIGNNVDVQSIKKGDIYNFNQSNFGSSSIKINDYYVDSKYIYEENGKKNVILSKENNRILMIIDGDLIIDPNAIFFKYVNNFNDFFNNFISVEYKYNGKVKSYNSVKTLNVISNNKIVISVPIELISATDIKLVINLRTKSIIIS